MHSVLAKTFGGLTPQYYFRHFIFAFVFSLFFGYMASQASTPMPLAFYGFLVINTLLYPYSRFVYEGIVGFIMGDNVFFVSMVAMLIAKVVSMTFCWSFAILIAPIGLAYLYYHHSKANPEN